MIQSNIALGLRAQMASLVPLAKVEQLPVKETVPESLVGLCWLECIGNFMRTLIQLNVTKQGIVSGHPYEPTITLTKLNLASFYGRSPPKM
jgi:hypothetical protein